MSDLFSIAGIDAPEKKKKVVRKRITNDKVDFIYTDSVSEVLGDMAVKAGLKWGISSAGAKSYYGINPVTFIDNDYFNYDHQLHLSVVKKHHPKYATVQDVMTKQQCDEHKIKYHPFGQIMDWAEELREHTDNVIVIPKYMDCLDKIPDYFMWGFSAGGWLGNSSHGKGNEVGPENFIGHRTHILGSSWKNQLEFLDIIGEWCVSLDNNWISKVAVYGTFVWPDGSTGKLREDLGLDVTNNWHTSLVISFGNIARKLNELYGGNNVHH